MPAFLWLMASKPFQGRHADPPLSAPIQPTKRRPAV